MREIAFAEVGEIPDVNYTVIFCVAGHGMNYEGMQVLLLNEPSPDTNFYNFFMIERDIRAMTENFSNLYVIAFFACCREYYNK